MSKTIFLVRGIVYWHSMMENPAYASDNLGQDDDGHQRAGDDATVLRR